MRERGDLGKIQGRSIDLRNVVFRSVGEGGDKGGRGLGTKE